VNVDVNVNVNVDVPLQQATVMSQSKYLFAFVTEKVWRSGGCRGGTASIECVKCAVLASFGGPQYVG
jgi:hypothetical protein